MPYVNEETCKRIDPEISAYFRAIFVEEPIHHVNERFIYWTFLIDLFEGIRAKIVELTKAEPRYADYNNQDGAFGCAAKELHRRWNKSVPLQFRFIDWNKMYESAVYGAETHVRLETLVKAIVEKMSIADPRALAGEVNYTISEVANGFGNEKRVDHQALFEMTIAAPYLCYEHWTGPYEDKAILKNGDTAGFLTFEEKFGPQSKRT